MDSTHNLMDHSYDSKSDCLVSTVHNKAIVRHSKEEKLSLIHILEICV